MTADLNVTPVPKSGDRHEVNNYRPVSALPFLAKILESIVHDQLFGYLERIRFCAKSKLGSDRTDQPKMCC